jgi:hypothetical protein
MNMITTLIESIPLDRAVLCMDCEVITMATNGHCPVCGGRGLARVQTLLHEPDQSFLDTPQTSSTIGGKSQEQSKEN